MVVPDATDDVSPTVVVGPSDGRRPAVAIAPDLDRPVGSWIDTDLHGWIASSANHALLARRADDHRDHLRPGAGSTVALRSSIPRAAVARRSRPPLVEGDIATLSLAVASDPQAPAAARVTVLACVGDRPVELVTIDSGGLTAEPGRTRVRTAIGSRWAA